MSMMYNKLVDTLVNRFEVDRATLTPDVTFDDLDMDSLLVVELLLIVQSELGVLITVDTVSPSDTVGRAAELIEDKVAAATAS